MRVAFQGERGAYSEEAIIKRFGNSAEPVPRPQLRDVFEFVMGNNADLGLIPVENTIEGTVGQAWDLLMEYPLVVEGEVILRVLHCLIANHGVVMKDVRVVYSHPQALGQCRAFLEKNGLDAISASDTAGSVRMIKELGLKDAAAIASCRAAEIYGIVVLSKGIETHSENFTRFLIIGHQRHKATGKDKTSLAFSLGTEAGSLRWALGTLVGHKVEIIRLDSRPLAGRPWQYIFFADIVGHIDDLEVRGVIRELEKNAGWVRLLGAYPRVV